MGFSPWLFTSNSNQYIWQIKYLGKIIGATWVDLEDTKELLAPSIHIMIGDTSHRSKGVGTACLATVIDYLELELLYKKIYSRHLITNTAIIRIQQKLDFENIGDSYVGEDGLRWQNDVRLSST